MFPQSKTQIILALIVASVFLFQSCTTFFSGSSGKSQKIPVTSDPQGAKIYVDGEEIGITPLNLELKRKKSHVVRIEKEGYNPLEIGLVQKTSASLAISVFGNAFWGFIGFWLGAIGGYYGAELLGLDPEEGVQEFVIGGVVGAILGWESAVLMDFRSGANYSLSPKELNVKLTRVQGKPQTKIVVIDTEQFQNIKWIRIRCTDTDEERFFRLN